MSALSSVSPPAADRPTSDIDRALDLIGSFTALRDELGAPLSGQVEQLRMAAIALAASATERRDCRLAGRRAAARGDLWSVMEMGQAERRLREREGDLIAQMGARLTAVIARCEDDEVGVARQATHRFFEAVGDAVRPL